MYGKKALLKKIYWKGLLMDLDCASVSDAAASVRHRRRGDAGGRDWRRGGVISDVTAWKDIGIY